MIEKSNRTGMSTMKRQNTIFIASILTIPIIHWFVFWLFLNAQSILMAFQLPTGDWSLLNFQVFWAQITNAESEIWLALKNTFIWFIFSSVFMFVFTLTLNYFFYKKIPGYRFFRIGLWIPGLVGSVAITAMVKNVVLPSGPLGVLLQKCGMEEVPLFFKDSRYANKAMLLYSFWMGWGGNMLLFGGAYARIPIEVLEAAKLDGCSPFRELFQLIIPMISSTLITMIILNMTGILYASGPVLLFTQGKYQTTTLSYWIFEKVRYGGSGTYNTVACTGLVFTCITVPLILTFRHFMEKIPVVEY